MHGIHIAFALELIAAAILLAPAATIRHRYRYLAGDEKRSATMVLVSTEDPLAAAGTLDLLAACLRAGLPMALSAKSAAALAPDLLRQSLSRAADLLSLGADPATAWSATAAGDDPVAESLARLARRSSRSGTSLAQAISELAGQHRDTVEDNAAARAERAGVLISGPLGLCFLPAFICLGIAPVVIGLAGRVLSGNGLT